MWTNLFEICDGRWTRRRMFIRTIGDTEKERDKKNGPKSNERRKRKRTRLRALDVCVRWTSSWRRRWQRGRVQRVLKCVCVCVLFVGGCVCEEISGRMLSRLVCRSTDAHSRSTYQNEQPIRRRGPWTTIQRERALWKWTKVDRWLNRLNGRSVQCQDGRCVEENGDDEGQRVEDRVRLLLLIPYANEWSTWLLRGMVRQIRSWRML